MKEDHSTWNTSGNGAVVLCTIGHTNQCYSIDRARVSIITHHALYKAGFQCRALNGRVTLLGRVIHGTCYAMDYLNPKGLLLGYRP